MFLSNPWLFLVQEKCVVTILDCRLQHGILWVSQATFLETQQFEKDLPQLSWKIREIRLLPVVEWDLSRPRTRWDQ